jgi:predicted phosphohydrolase
MIEFLGKFLILLGAILIFLGLVFSFAGKIPYVGRLPGDILITKGNFTFYFPLGTSILISIVLTVIFYLLSRFFK